MKYEGPAPRKTPDLWDERCREPGARAGALIARVSSSRRSSFHMAWKVGRHNPLDESLQVAIAGAEATQEVQHQGTDDHRFAEVVEGVRER
jgi:hypothetical protein